MGVNFFQPINGFDPEILIQGLVKLERIPELDLQNRIANTNVQISTVGQLTAQLNDLQTTATGLNTVTQVSSLMATTSDNTRVTASATNSATVGTYAVNVQQLAQAQISRSNQFATNTAGVAGAGTLTLTAGANPAVNVTYGAGDTLDGIAAKINSASSAVSAAVIFDGSKYSITVSGKSTGAANAVTFSDAPSSGAGIGFGAGSTVAAALDAKFSLNGINITRSNNTVTDAVNGVTFNLLSVTPGGSANTLVNVATDVNGLQSKVQSIITRYNNVIATINGQLSLTPGQKPAPGQLFGDSTLSLLQHDIGMVLAQSFPYTGGSTTPGQLGINLNNDGTLTLDATKFTAAVNADPLAVQHLLVGTNGSDGLATALSNMVTNYTDPVSGSLKAESNGFTALIKQLNDQINTIENNANSLDTRLRAQFTALEQQIAQMQAQQGSLSFSGTSNTGK